MRFARAQVCWAAGRLLPALFACWPAAAFAAEGAAAASPASHTSAAQPVEVARARYRQGVEAFKGGHYRESIDYFLEADRLAPSAALSFNIAMAYERIDDAAAALRWYRDYLRRAPDAKDRSTVEETIHSYESRLMAKGVQQVTVSSDPEGATLLVDGKAVGVTPWTLEVAPGSHGIELRLDGYDSAKQTIDVIPDHAADVPVTLQKAAAAAAPTAAATAAPAPASSEPATAPAGSREEASSSGVPLRTWGIVGMAAGGAALGGSLVFELLRRSAESAAESERTQVGYADHVDSMQSRQTVARILLGTGVVLAATGGVLFFLGGKKDAPHGDTALAVTCLPGGCATTIHGRF